MDCCNNQMDRDDISFGSFLKEMRKMSCLDTIHELQNGKLEWNDTKSFSSILTYVSDDMLFGLLKQIAKSKWDDGKEAQIICEFLDDLNEKCVIIQKTHGFKYEGDCSEVLLPRK